MNRGKYFDKSPKVKKIFSFIHLKYLKIEFIILLIIFFFIDLIKSVSKIQKNNNCLQKKIIIETNEYKNFEALKEKTTSPSLVKELKEINIIKHIFEHNIEHYKKKKNIIHITVSLNNDKNYKYIILVSMFSLLSNCNKNKSFIIYHILCSPNFNKTSLTIFKSLVNKFFQNVEMIFYNMGNQFNNRKNLRYSEAAFYRLITPLFINEEKIIHLDGDTLIFSDLNEMYNLDFNDNYILGVYDYLSGGIDYLGLKSRIYINSGTILLNLRKMREDNKVLEILNFTRSNVKLKNVDQTVFNYLLYPKIGRLPSKYVIFNFEDKSDIEVYINHLRTKIPIKEVEDAFKNPTIIHNIICYPKVWFSNTVYTKGPSACAQRKNCSCKKYFDIWHYFAKKTDYYEEIVKFTLIKNNHRNQI